MLPTFLSYQVGVISQPGAETPQPRPGSIPEGTSPPNPCGKAKSPNATLTMQFCKPNKLPWLTKRSQGNKKLGQHTKCPLLTSITAGVTSPVAGCHYAWEMWRQSSMVIFLFKIHSSWSQWAMNYYEKREDIQLFKKWVLKYCWQLFLPVSAVSLLKSSLEYFCLPSYCVRATQKKS